MGDNEDVEAYYNKRVAGKLADFTGFNPRIEAAVETIAEWSPLRPKRVLEIGCGIGATSWRMARAWPEAEVIGADISRMSVEVAQACFRRPNLRYVAGAIEAGSLPGKFDLVVLMDVYEHIPPAERPALHGFVRAALADEARVIMTVPTPAMQAWLHRDHPEAIQPVDEDIDLGVAETFARETQTDLVHYRQVGIWRYGDYAHLVFGRFSPAPVIAREAKPSGLPGLKHRVKRLIGRTATDGEKDYLGYDFGRARTAERRRRFQVAARERRQIAAAWSNGRE
ncbi:MAG TPA: methyltransferase domain-containing protein [Caulobacteraceae bacterium]|nr:methyltransferase domain-containing protein [Caulobacteraceae bacterium]